MQYLRCGQRNTECIVVRVVGGVTMQLSLLKSLMSLPEVGMVKLATTNVRWVAIELFEACLGEEERELVVGLGPQADVEVTSDQGSFSVVNQVLKILNQGR